MSLFFCGTIKNLLKTYHSSTFNFIALCETMRLNSEFLRPKILDPLQYYFQAFFSSSLFSTRHCLSPVLKKRIIVCDLYLTAPAFFPENTRPTAWLSQNGLCFFQSIICKSIWWRLKDALKSSHCILSICLDRHGIWLSGQSCLVRILPEPLLKGQTFIC